MGNILYKQKLMMNAEKIEKDYSSVLTLIIPQTLRLNKIKIKSQR